MKRRFLAIALSLALLAPVAVPGITLPVQAEEDENQTPEGEGDSDTDKDQTPEGEGDDDTDKGKTPEGEGDSDPDKDETPEGEGNSDTDKDEAPKSESNSDPEQNQTPEDKGNEQNQTPEGDDDKSDDEGETGLHGILYSETYDLEDLPSLYQTDASAEETDDEDDGIMANSLSLTNSGLVGDNLEGLYKAAYDYVISQLQLIATGQRASTELIFTLSEEQYEQLLKDFEDDTTEEHDVFWTRLFRIFNAAYYDCPNSLYWWDRRSGIGFNADQRQIIFKFGVEKRYCDESSYRESDKRYYAINTDGEDMANALEAMENADLIAHEADGMGAYDALLYFHDRINDLVVYDNDAAALTVITDHVASNMINVFDMDPDTNVICEGYAKSYKYLVDEWMTVEENRERMEAAVGEGVTCIVVTGLSTDPTTTPTHGAHMWDLLWTQDARYLIDTTNTDEEGTGYPYKLFLKKPAAARRKEINGTSRTWRYWFDGLGSYGSGSMQYAYCDYDKGKYTYQILELYTNDQIGSPFGNWDPYKN